MYNRKIFSYNFQYICPINLEGKDPNYKYPVVKRNSLEKELIKNIRVMVNPYHQLLGEIFMKSKIQLTDKQTDLTIIMTSIKNNDTAMFNDFLFSKGIKDNAFINRRFIKLSDYAKNIIKITNSKHDLVIPNFARHGLEWLSFLIGKDRIRIDDIILVRDSAQPSNKIKLDNFMLKEYLKFEHNIELRKDESVLAVNLTILPK